MKDSFSTFSDNRAINFSKGHKNVRYSSLQQEKARHGELYCDIVLEGYLTILRVTTRRLQEGFLDKRNIVAKTHTFPRRNDLERA